MHNARVRQTNRQRFDVGHAFVKSTSNPSCSINPSISVSPSSVQQASGGSFTVSGSGFTPNGTVRRFIQQPGQASQEISGITANGSGQISWGFAPGCADPVGNTQVWTIDASSGK